MSVGVINIGRHIVEAVVLTDGTWSFTVVCILLSCYVMFLTYQFDAGHIRLEIILPSRGMGDLVTSPQERFSTDAATTAPLIQNHRKLSVETRRLDLEALASDMENNVPYPNSPVTIELEETLPVTPALPGGLPPSTTKYVVTDVTVSGEPQGPHTSLSEPSTRTSYSHRNANRLSEVTVTFLPSTTDYGTQTDPVTVAPDCVPSPSPMLHMRRRTMQQRTPANEVAGGGIQHNNVESNATGAPTTTPGSQTTRPFVAPLKVSASGYHLVPCKLEWRKGSLLGRGAYGSVFLAMDERTGRMMAVKSIEFDANDENVQRRVEQLQREITVMRTLQHPNIVQYLYAEKVDTTVNIFMEYVAGGSLAAVLHQFGPMTEAVCGIFVRQILCGLQFLHDNRVLHRDIKGGNILLSADGVAKLSDFGAAAIVEDCQSVQRKSVCGTPIWMAPEIIANTGHNWSADIWSLGCTVLEMLTGKAPFAHLNMNPLGIMNMLISLNDDSVAPLPPGLSPLATEFLNLCLHPNKYKRPTAEELSKHPFLGGTQGSKEGRERSASATASEKDVSHAQEYHKRVVTWVRQHTEAVVEEEVSHIRESMSRTSVVFDVGEEEDAMLLEETCTFDTPVQGALRTSSENGDTVLLGSSPCFYPTTPAPAVLASTPDPSQSNSALGSVD